MNTVTGTPVRGSRLRGVEYQCGRCDGVFAFHRKRDAHRIDRPGGKPTVCGDCTEVERDLAAC